MPQTLFLDRDGTVSEEVGYVNHIGRFHVYPWTAEAVRRLNEAGWKVILVTNQSGIARGYFPTSLVEEIHRDLQQTLSREGARLDGIYFCPHHPEGIVAEYKKQCGCRKPRPGMLKRAAKEHRLDLSDCWVVGDRYLETRLAHQVGAQSALVMTGYGRGEYAYTRQYWAEPPELMAENLLEVVNLILEQAENNGTRKTND